LTVGHGFDSTGDFDHALAAAVDARRQDTAGHDLKSPLDEKPPQFSSPADSALSDEPTTPRDAHRYSKRCRAEFITGTNTTSRQETFRAFSLSQYFQYQSYLISKMMHLFISLEY